MNSRSTSSLIVFAQPRYVALQCVTFCAVRNGLCSFSVTIARCIAFSSCFFSADVRRIIVFLLLCGLFFLFSSSIRQQIERVRQLQQQIGPGRGHVARAPQRRFRPVDVYAQLCEQGDPSFRIATRFTRSQFDDLVVELRPLIMANRHIRTNVPEPTGHLRSAKQTVENRLLMAIKFLVHGSSVGDLAIQFGVSKSAVSEELRHVIFALVSGLAYEIAWPTLEQQQRLKGLLGPRFANAIGTLDGTYTQTWRRHGDFSATGGCACERLKSQRTVWATLFMCSRAWWDRGMIHGTTDCRMWLADWLQTTRTFLLTLLTWACRILFPLQLRLRSLTLLLEQSSTSNTRVGVRASSHLLGELRRCSSCSLDAGNELIESYWLSASLPAVFFTIDSSD